MLPCRWLSARSATLLLALGILTAPFVPTGARAVDDDYEGKALPVRSASQCFHVPGVPVVNLRCGLRELIRVLRAFYGVTPQLEAEAGPAEGGRARGRAARVHACSYDPRAGAATCIQDINLKENCMGRAMCTLAVSNPFLATCEQYATYMQVNYTCIPRESVRDMCDQTEVTAWRGYLSSPHYPSPYGPNAHCQCSLKTKDRSILLHILDFSLNVTRGRADGRCQEDRLRIAGWGDKCNPVVPEGLPETLGLREQAVTLSFRSDARRQARGFWFEFRGSNGGKVTVICGQRPEESSSNSDVTNDENESDHYQDNRSPQVDAAPPHTAWPTAHIQSTLQHDLDGKHPQEEDGLHDGPKEQEQEDGYDDVEETTDNNVVLVDDGRYQRGRPVGVREGEEVDNQVDNGEEGFAGNDFANMDNNEFETYDFTDQAEYHLYNVGDVQLATGIVVSVLILIAVVIIIVLVFRR